MIKKNLKTILIIAVFILAAVLRLYRLGDYPVSIYWDEAAIGYNAYSIAQTGADEYGRKWPLSFESFNDFKLPGYIYLDSIFVKTLGLSEFSVRLPSAIAGILGVIFVYLLTKKLFTLRANESESRSNVIPDLIENPDPRIREDDKYEKFSTSPAKGGASSNNTLPIIAALLLTISPWHLQLSRAAFETNIALTLTLAGIYLLFIAVNKKIFALIASPILALSFYFYYSSYIFAPLILLAFLAINRERIAKNIKYYLAGITIALFVITPAISQLLTSEGSKHVREVSIFADRSLPEQYIAASATREEILSKFFINRRIPVAIEALDNYFIHFSPGFLFFGSDPNARHHPVGIGNLFIWQIPFLVAGLWFLVKLKDIKLKCFLLAIVAIAPIPAAFTIEVPHSLRAYNLVITVTIASAVGIVYLIKSSTLKIVTAIVAIIFFTHYLYNYYLIYPIKHDAAWAYGYKDLYRNLANFENSYDTIIVTGYYWKPYIYYLFYNQTEPAVYQSNPDQTAIGKYKFGIAGWDTGGQDLNSQLIDNLKSGKTLVVLSPGEAATDEVGKSFSKIFEIKNYAKTQTIFLAGSWE